MNDWNKHRMTMPKYVGQWVISPGVMISLEKKPNRLVRFMTKLLLNWDWRDYELS
jgi:hypothetical protein